MSLVLIFQCKLKRSLQDDWIRYIVHQMNTALLIRPCIKMNSERVTDINGTATSAHFQNEDEGKILMA